MSITCNNLKRSDSDKKMFVYESLFNWYLFLLTCNLLFSSCYKNFKQLLNSLYIFVEIIKNIRFGFFQAEPKHIPFYDKF
jgi:hypothetical protein